MFDTQCECKKNEKLKQRLDRGQLRHREQLTRRCKKYVVFRKNSHPQCGLCGNVNEGLGRVSVHVERLGEVDNRRDVGRLVDIAEALRLIEPRTREGGGVLLGGHRSVRLLRRHVPKAGSHEVEGWEEKERKRGREGEGRV